MIRVVSTTDEFETLKKVWESVGSRNSLRIFQTYEWCLAAWKLYLDDGINKLRILVWTQEHNPETVIFPFLVDGNGTLRFIMDEHSDVCDVIYVPGANHHLAYKEALEYVKGDPSIRRTRLTKLCAESEILNYWGALIVKASIFRANTYSWIDVVKTDDFAASQIQLRSKDKANIRAIRRKADKYQLKVFSKRLGLEYPVRDIEQIIEKMVVSGRRSQDFMPLPLRAFCKSIYDQGLADVIELVDSLDNPIALNFVLRMGIRRLSWIFLYTNPHASTEMYVKYLYKEAGVNDFIFDFGTGGYDYKLGTFRPHLRMLFALSYDMWKRERLLTYCACCIRNLKDIVKTIIRK